jgi:hypothetical protein
MSLEWPTDPLIMDESPGRAMARNLNIKITGTLGVLLKAKRAGQIPSLRFEMDRLIQDAGFSDYRHDCSRTENWARSRGGTSGGGSEGAGRRCAVLRRSALSAG